MATTLTKPYPRLWSIEAGRVMVVTDLHGDWDAYRRYRDCFVDLRSKNLADWLIFTGDLIHSRGKVWQGYQLDWDHWRGLGHEAEFQSLLRIKDEQDGGKYHLTQGDDSLTFEFVVGPDGVKRHLFPPSLRLMQFHVHDNQQPILKGAAHRRAVRAGRSSAGGASMAQKKSGYTD